MRPKPRAIFLDANAGLPLRREVSDALRAFLAEGEETHHLPNPSSIHSHGRKAKRLLADARERVALSLGSGVDPEQIVFTSGGTEANQLAIRSVLEPLLEQGLRPHWLTTPV